MKLLFSVFVLVAFQASAPVIRVNPYAFPSGSTLNDGLIAHWSLEEPTGTRVDSEPTGTAQNLTDNNTVGTVGGIEGNAALFVSANSESLSHVDSADLSVGNIDFAVAAWLKFTDILTSQSIVSHYQASGEQRAWDMRYNSTSGKLNWVVSSDGTAVTTLEMTTFGTPATNTWIFFYAQHDAATDTIYGSVNDTSTGSTAHTTGVLNSTADFTVGANSGGTRYFYGAIDEVSFWKRILTSAEITELYNAGAGKFCCPY